MKLREYKPKEVFLGKPPKWYNKKKSISVFFCNRTNLKCMEIIRIRITNNKEIYLFPMVEYLEDYHLSYHKSGKFHLTDQGKHFELAYGKDALNTALRMFLSARKCPCYCLTKGKKLDINEIRELVKIVVTYLPFEMNIDKTSQVLNENSFIRFISPDAHEMLTSACTKDHKVRAALAKTASSLTALCI